MRLQLGLFLVVLCLSQRGLLSADIETNYSLPDEELRTVRIDSSDKESFLSVRVDSLGRVFVGGREALFRYDPNEQGGYQDRRELVRFPADTWIYDIEIRGTDLYVVTISAVYRIPEGAVKTEGLKPERLIWGMPFGHVHQGMHGLAWGPEGDLYISMGDPLWYYGDFKRPDHWGHWTFFGPNGSKVPYTGMGGVLRCRPDGSNLQVVARGTRNSCGLAFDRHWNLFSNDNDHESKPAEYVPGRLLHVAPHSFQGWPRGWMQSKSPDRFDMLPDMFEGMGRGVPVGQAYYDEDFLPARFRNNLLVARWGNRTVSRYPLRRSGASFKTDEFVVLEGDGQARPVGVCVGRGGRIFVTIAYMDNNESSPIYKSELVMITRSDDPEAHPFASYDAASANTSELLEELDDASWQRRYRAHTELLRRQSDSDRAAAEHGPRDWPTFDLSKATKEQLTHQLWLEATNSTSAAKLIPFAQDDSSQVRAHAVRAIAEFYGDQPDVQAVLNRALSDADAGVQHAALVGLFGQDGQLPQEVLIGPARSNDAYLRQTATILMAERATREMLVGACESDDVKTRLAGVLAVGFRLTVPRATAQIAADLPMQKWKKDEAYHPSYFRDQIDLSKLGRIGTFTIAEHWNVRKPTRNQEMLYGLLFDRLSDSDSRVRLQAAYFLSLLKDSKTEPAIAKVRSDSARHQLLARPATSVRSAWVAGPFFDRKAGGKVTHPPEIGPIDLSAKYSIESNGARQAAWALSPEADSFEFGKRGKPSSYYVYFRLQSSKQQSVLLQTKSGGSIRIRHNGNVVFNNMKIREKGKPKDSVMLGLEPGSNDVLVRAHYPNGTGNLQLQYQAFDSVTFALPENLGIASLAERLKAAGDGPVKIAPEFTQVDWVTEVKKGDVERGRKLFGIDGISCAKCHAVDARSGVSGAPSLVGAAKRFTVPHLVESILLPSKQVSPIFRATMIVTDDGKVRSGLVVGETSENLQLILPDATRIEIAIDSIEERRFQDLSPMPAGLVKTPEELRDILMYLLQQK